MAPPPLGSEGFGISGEASVAGPAELCPAEGGREGAVGFQGA
jgi:hypothetical protein